MKIRLVISTAAVLVLSACAASKAAGRVPTPIQREHGKPVELPILGATYSFPAHLDLPDHQDDPGRYILDYVDRITRCTGWMHFETVTALDAHQSYTRNEMAKYQQDWEADQVRVETRVDQVKLLNQDARQTTFSLTREDQKAAAAYFDHHIEANNLSMIGYAFCEDPKLLAQTVDAVKAVMNSQRR